jgi:hypothetical protein
MNECVRDTVRDLQCIELVIELVIDVVKLQLLVDSIFYDRLKINVHFKNCIKQEV